MSDSKRLIYAEDAKDLAIKLRRTVKLDKYTGGWPCLLLTDINDVPTADAAPIIHAHWKRVYDDSAGWIDECSNCGSSGDTTPYCSKCGAKMDKEGYDVKTS